MLFKEGKKQGVKVMVTRLTYQKSDDKIWIVLNVIMV